MTVRINGLTAREIVVAANRAKVKAPVNNLLRFAAEVSGKALSNSNSFDWRAALAKSKAFIESTMDADAAAEILRPFFDPVISPDVPVSARAALDMRGGLEAAARRFATGGEQFSLPNEDEVMTIVGDAMEVDSDGGNCD
jgi:hypothetical protein